MEYEISSLKTKICIRYIYGSFCQTAGICNFEISYLQSFITYVVITFTQEILFIVWSAKSFERVLVVATEKTR